MNAINNLLTSGHRFSEDDNLLKFRFFFFNAVMLLVSFLTVINYSASLFGFIDSGRTFENAILIFLITIVFVFILLRKKRSFYSFIVIYFLSSSLFLFYYVVLTRPEDEFRLICFFLITLITYILLGRKYGMGLSLLILISIIVIGKFYDLTLSHYAYSSFYTFFITFTAFLYFFFKKVESDAIEYQVLNAQLRNNVINEIQQRRDQEIMLLHQCRMANMGEMLDSIAHQWRQPLMHINSILMNMDVALENNQKDEKYLTNRIDDVANLTLHMSQTIEDFRNLFQLETEQYQFAIESVFADVIALMKNRFDNISVDYMAVGDTLVYGYKNELVQVLIILLNNAVDAFDRKPVDNRFININTNVSADRTLITIEDNAGGIDSDITTAIFDPYITTKQQSGGTGLGLYIAKIIVEKKMNGEITAASTADGAVFSITLVDDSNRSNY